jgi:U3 small nucleolar RNA-associated protein 25
VNQVPKGQHGVDIMRVREWYLSGHAKQHRQTILLSSFATAEANALFNRTCVNHAGKARLKVAYKVRVGMFLSAA